MEGSHFAAQLAVLPPAGPGAGGPSGLHNGKNQKTRPAKHTTAKTRVSASPPSRTPDTSSSWLDGPPTEDSGSDIVVQLEPLSGLGSSPELAFAFPGPGGKALAAVEPPSPGTLKKQLFLQRLDRRGVSHDDPKFAS